MGTAAVRGRARGARAEPPNHAHPAGRCTGFSGLEKGEFDRDVDRLNEGAENLGHGE